MVTLVLLDRSVQAKAAEGFDKNAFTVNWKTRQVRCLAGKTSSPLEPGETERHRRHRDHLQRPELQGMPLPEAVHHVADRAPHAHPEARGTPQDPRQSRAEQKTDT
jgi:hypothetical protein